RAGKVYALTDANHDGVAERVRVIASGLRLPIGVAFHEGDLYISAVSKILRLRDIEKHLDQPPSAQVITDKLPDEGHHGGRFIAFGPDGKLYVPIGAPCNICNRQGYARLLRMDADCSHWQAVAEGIRNSVGFAWQPGSGDLWFTDNGRDLLGDDIPSDELNHISKLGQHFGYPYCHAGDILDAKFGRGKTCADYVPPSLKLGAHVAALGMRFYQGKQFPKRYHGAAFIAEHGSWNRSKKVGYRVVAVFIQGDKVIGSEPFLTGFLDAPHVLGRPVDVLELSDGSLLVSDDRNGAIYRISHARTKR
ncbi:MAG: PQQ-dependent sugar dehydrogenase, partial [Xanthomonadales bacterium]|nr:PQQ-dependent sugar dehydrogenase [Xanthomonadales bacterium]